jgi:hypothetical protein
VNYTESNNTYFAKPKNDWKDRIEIEIGDSKQADFYPQLKVMRWDNEVNFSVRLKHDELTPTVSKQGEKVKWQGGKIEAHFYNILEGEGGHEFEVILKEKPKVNVIEFTLNTKGLDFVYQLPLDELRAPEDIANGGVIFTPTEVRDIDGNIIVRQPENVVGSYVIMTSERKINWTDGKLYKIGMAGIIYRPKIIDSAGTEVWGSLNVNKEKGILSVTIPQDFLDKAVYPVRHAAGLTIGYSTSGAVENSWAVNTAMGSYENAAASANGTVDSVSLYGRGSDTNQPVFKGLVTTTARAILTNGVSNASASIPNTTTWYTATFTTKPSVVNETSYYPWVVIGANSIASINRVNGAGTHSQYESDNNYATPTNPSGVSDSGNYYCVYATYTAAAGKRMLEMFD